MKKLLILVFLFSAAGVSRAHELAIIYPANSPLDSKSAFVAVASSAGVTLTAQEALLIGATCYGGLLGQDLKFGNLLWVDVQKNSALFSMGSIVQDPVLQEAHKKKVIRVGEVGDRALLPSVSSPNSPGMPLSSSEPFLIKLNESLIGSDPITLTHHGEQSVVKLQVMRSAPTAVWRISIEITSQPDLRFWKKGKEKTLIDVPQKKFTYDHQAMFSTLGYGASFTIPIEVYFIKQEAYKWTIKIKSKDGSVEKKVSVVFK